MCGLDALRGASLAEQERLFVAQIDMAESLNTHCSCLLFLSCDRLLRLHKQLRPTTQWTVHGFRGKPALARQLLDAGIDLSFGQLHNAASWEVTPPQRRHTESD